MDDNKRKDKFDETIRYDVTDGSRGTIGVDTTRLDETAKFVGTSDFDIKHTFSKDKGVIYTPSRELEKTRKTRKTTEHKGIIRRDITKTSSSPRSIDGYNEKKSHSQFAVFFITTVFIGAVACVLVFAMLLNSVTTKRSSKTPKSPLANDLLMTPSEKNDEINMQNEITKTITALIMSTFDTEKEFTLYDLDNDEVHAVYADGTTEMRDKFGTAMVYGEFKQGEIVEATFSNQNNLLSSLKISNLAWSFNDVSNVTVDYESKMMNFANSTHHYTDNTLCSYNGETYAITDINPIDIISVKGYKDFVYSINITKSHGIVNVIKRNDISNGIVEIDTVLSVPLSQASGLVVSEGAHKVVIKGDNIESITREINVARGETQDINLDNIQLRSGNLKININQSDAKIYINDVERNIKESIILEYGEYRLKATKDGFLDWEKTIIINSANRDVNINLEKIIKYHNLTIETKPEGAEVYVDNVYVGISPVEASIEEGRRSITVKKEGYAPANFSVDITKDSPFSMTLDKLSANIPTTPDIEKENSNNNNENNNDNNDNENNNDNNNENNTEEPTYEEIPETPPLSETGDDETTFMQQDNQQNSDDIDFTGDTTNNNTNFSNNIDREYIGEQGEGDNEIILPDSISNTPPGTTAIY